MPSTIKGAAVLGSYQANEWVGQQLLDTGGNEVGEIKAVYLEGRCPQQVRLKDVVPLEARIGMETGVDSVGLLAFDVPAEGADVTLVLHSPGFEPRSPIRRTVHVPLDGPSQWALFEIEATEEGVHEIMVSAF